MSSTILISPLADERTIERWCSEQDFREAETLGTAHRRAEFLSWRAMVRKQLGEGVRIGYDEWGAPIIEHSEQHIGVSHSKDMVAVIISNAPCAIDIEHTGRNFERVASRYLTDEERALDSHADFLAAAWCAKETLYKYYRRGKIDFLRDILLTSSNVAEGQICGCTPSEAHLQMSVQREGEYIVVVLGN